MFTRPESCSTCGRPIVSLTRGVVVFKCPQCSNTIIARCPTCREQAMPYTCKDCGFVGP